MPISFSLRGLIFATAGLHPPGMDVRHREHAQSLGDVARREAEWRKDASRTPGRVYTNGDLVAVEAPPSGPLQPAQTDSAPPADGIDRCDGTSSQFGPHRHGGRSRNSQGEHPTTEPRREKRDEPYWRARARTSRDRLAKATADLTAAQVQPGGHRWSDLKRPPPRASARL